MTIISSRSCCHSLFRGFLILLTGSVLLCSRSLAQERGPLQLRNQNPLVNIFGLPVAENPVILEPGRETSHLSLDWASNFTNAADSSELIYLDGESGQLNIRWRYGFDLWEFGIDVNYSRFSGGRLDSFIEDWHSLFGLPNGGRELADRNQLRYEYSHAGLPPLSITEQHSGFGDTRLTGAYQIRNSSRFDLALRGGLKLPTGDSDKLLGSGGTDFNLGFVLGDTVSLQPYRSSYYLGAGLLWTEDGDILPAYRKNTIYYYQTGLIRDVFERWQIKVQLDGHSAFYQSELDPLGHALQLGIGAAYRISNDLKIDFAVAEDVITDSSSDVNFHFSLYNYF